MAEILRNISSYVTCLVHFMLRLSRLENMYSFNNVIYISYVRFIDQVVHGTSWPLAETYTRDYPLAKKRTRE
jgi:hypothetical protein